jgi:hypothetical protein
MAEYSEKAQYGKNVNQSLQWQEIVKSPIWPKTESNAHNG